MFVNLENMSIQKWRWNSYWYISQNRTSLCCLFNKIPPKKLSLLSRADQKPVNKIVLQLTRIWSADLILLLFNKIDPLVFKMSENSGRSSDVLFLSYQHKKTINVYIWEAGTSWFCGNFCLRMTEKINKSSKWLLTNSPPVD